MTEPIGRSYDSVAARYSQEFGDELADKPLDRGLDVVARLDRSADGIVEHPSQRTYLLAKNR